MDTLTPGDEVVSYLETTGTQSRVSPIKPLPVTAPSIAQGSAEFNVTECLAAILDELRNLRLDIQQLQGSIVIPN